MNNLKNTNKLSIGFPRMHKEPSEVRDFLPPLIQELAPLVHKIVLEEGYGSGMGIESEEYTKGYSNVYFGTNQESYDQDMVIQVRSPEYDDLAKMKPNTILFAMLHYPTHAKRVALMKSLGLKSISMDYVVDDSGQRLIEHMRGTSWNAVEAGFKALAKTYTDFESPSRKPIKVVVIGAGATGRFAAEAAAKYGNTQLNKAFLKRDIPGVVVNLIDRSITKDFSTLQSILIKADMIVDTAYRTDYTKCIVPNEVVGLLPQHAVLVDIAAERYILNKVPIQVKGIEGIPVGSLDNYEFPPNHPAYSEIPQAIQTTHQRTAVSCYSWPGVKPKECMRRYGQQISPLVKVLLQTPYDELSPNSNNYYERALYRATLKNN